MKGWVTINTDAGFLYRDKIGAYAYWIKAEGLFLKGSGIFKKKCTSPLDAEQKAIINAVHILIASGYQGIVKVIFNRDATKTKADLKGKHPLQIALAKKIEELRIQSGYTGYYPFFEMRYVKAHSNGETKRKWVNNWLDKQCSDQLKKARKKLNDRRPNTTGKVETGKMG